MNLKFIEKVKFGDGNLRNGQKLVNGWYLNLRGWWRLFREIIGKEEGLILYLCLLIS